MKERATPVTDHTISRRVFLKTAGAAAIGVGLAACQPITPDEGGEAALGEVTAAQVTDPESLKAFVLGAKTHIEGLTSLDEVGKLREVIKTEGRWKSGSTFLIVFLMNGDAVFHGAGQDSEDKNLLDVEDERGTRVVQELLAAAALGGGHVEYYDEGLKTAYAVEYTSGMTGNKLVLVGGYSQDVSHVKGRIADLPRPEVTASEVVDRETLIAFVEAAAQTYQDAVLSEGYSDFSGVRNAFRLEGGDWKAGSIYLYIVSGGGVTLFHGTEPFREGRPTDMTRTDSNGVRFAEELIGGARREGRKFLRYYYDDPTIEGDEDSGSPKLGYAVSYQMPNSDQRGVVGSGIYLAKEEE